MNPTCTSPPSISPQAGEAEAASESEASSGGEPGECKAAPGTKPVAAGLVPPRATYGPTFWWVYLSNSTTMVAVCLLFRYGDFVAHLDGNRGGSEGRLGLIVGVGMVGSLLMRLVQGVAIDRYGSRRIWTISQAAFIASLLGHLLVRDSSGWYLFALRVLYSTSVAGIFGASVTFISRRAPAHRVAEVIGSLGTSGFLAMLIGPQLGDWICREHPISRANITALFLTAAGMGLLSLLAAFAATMGQPHMRPRRMPPLWQVLKRYQPGAILLAAVAMGVGVGMPHTFLRTYADALDLHKIGAFFSIYAAVALVARLATTRVPARFGVRPMIVIGLLFLALSMWLYLPVRQTWQFALPAVAAGIAHALLFPAIVGGGSTAFPARYRGVGTTLMMGAFDVGVFLGAPAIGAMIHLAEDRGWPPYPTTFVSISVLLIAVAAIYFWRSAPKVENGESDADASEFDVSSD